MDDVLDPLSVYVEWNTVMLLVFAYERSLDGDYEQYVEASSRWLDGDRVGERLSASSQFVMSLVTEVCVEMLDAGDISVDEIGPVIDGSPLRGVFDLDDLAQHVRAITPIEFAEDVARISQGFMISLLTALSGMDGPSPVDQNEDPVLVMVAMNRLSCWVAGCVADHRFESIADTALRALSSRPPLTETLGHVDDGTDRYAEESTLDLESLGAQHQEARLRSLSQRGTETVNDFVAPVWGDDHVVRWSWNGGLTPSITVDEGQIFVADADRLNALDVASGSVMWSIELSNVQPPSVACSGDLVVIGHRALLPTDRSEVECRDRESGTQVWCCDVAPRLIHSSGAPVHGGLVAFGAQTSTQDSNQLVALDVGTGDVMWRRAVGPVGGVGTVHGQVMALLGDGDSLRVTTFGRDGSVRWSTGFELRPANLAGTKDHLFIGFDDHGGDLRSEHGTISEIQALDLRTGEMLWAHDGLRLPPDDFNDRVMPCGEGTLAVVQDSTTALIGVDGRRTDLPDGFILLKGVDDPVVRGGVLAMAWRNDELAAFAPATMERRWTTAIEAPPVAAAECGSAAVVVGSGIASIVSLRDGEIMWTCDLPDERLESIEAFTPSTLVLRPAAGFLAGIDLPPTIVELDDDDLDLALELGSQPLPPALNG